MARETFCIGDTHGNHIALKGLLEQEGLLKRGNRLRPEVQVVSLGDLINAVPIDRDDDLKCLRMVGPYIDDYILGNHETPYFGFSAFNGFFMFPEVKDKLKQLDNYGFIKPCMVVNNIFLSHAGLCNHFNIQSPQEAVQSVTEAFLYEPSNPIVSAISWYRGGSSKFGGIFWSHWDEPKNMNFMQICGHTVGSDIRCYLNGKTKSITDLEMDYLMLHEHDGDADDAPALYPTFNIDIGCRVGKNQIAGVWITEDRIDFVRYEE